MDALLASRLVVFVKAARPGFVKTRLARTLGDEAACVVYRELVAAVLGNITVIPSVELRFSPDDAMDVVESWAQPGWTMQPQGAGNLGERMHRAFIDHFENGAERVVIIGSDSPEISTTDISDAWDALVRRDVVLGPALDGGYWLIGLRRHRFELFDGISWSTESVLRETLARVDQMKLTFHLLRQLSDVDTQADVRAWRRRQAEER
ncbi:MAG: TIGR04282 family arsenosugar biosynthesis glycosyltransferase [Opitutaceae bacterium]|nr:TIGR04282 family arsenosugar biosynthesis glycosyltransferase [Verrucomicrobiales bacterium]